MVEDMLSQSDGPQAEAGKEEAGLDPMTRVVNLNLRISIAPGLRARAPAPRL